MLEATLWLLLQVLLRRRRQLRLLLLPTKHAAYRRGRGQGAKRVSARRRGARTVRAHVLEVTLCRRGRASVSVSVSVRMSVSGEW